MLALKNGKTLPGWRDFERSVAFTFNGEAMESKAIFDVVLATRQPPQKFYGLSCKMRNELNRIEKTGRVTIELSNSSGQFWNELAVQNLDVSNYREEPAQVGKALINLVKKWHTAAGVNLRKPVEVSESSFLVLSWNRAGLYQIHQFSLALPDPDTLTWSFPRRKIKGVDQPARRIHGKDETGTLFEWYGESGGQLKYYPLASSANWQSEPFRLEPLPDQEQGGILAKVTAYFPKQWANAAETQ